MGSLLIYQIPNYGSTICCEYYSTLSSQVLNIMNTKQMGRKLCLILVATKDTKITLFNNDDMFVSVASGSSDYDAMVLVPCSMGSLALIAQGVSSDLISRAGDVMLKERKKILFVVRETPLSLIHLRNMVAVTEAGGIIVPASPSMYSHPENIEELCNTVTERIMQLLKIDTERYKWGGNQ